MYKGLGFKWRRIGIEEAIHLVSNCLLLPSGISRLHENIVLFSYGLLILVYYPSSFNRASLVGFS